MVTSSKESFDSQNIRILHFSLTFIGSYVCRLLDFRRTPLAVGRIINLETEIKPVAKQRLLETFFKRGNNTCFYGKCYYCKVSGYSYNLSSKQKNEGHQNKS